MTDSSSTRHRPSSCADAAARRSWWRSGWMWLVVGIPGVTLVAAIVTTVMAVRLADPPVAPRHGERPVHVRQANE